ncbi:hypothetical protein [Austwickia sp. TVS 96-490-7B]|uniref:hypothetical protein n=1 Tax=Austwickia sp. TVS 96-490-7B TaxID=2830843 RepID=UPI001C594534|nr:hypothetical protein [Austwickia sp. TVS 96-490-7B]
MPTAKLLFFLVAAAALCSCGGNQELHVDDATKAALLSVAQKPPELDTAVKNVTKECMKKKGFSYDPPAIPQDSADANLGGIIGLRGLDQARQNGFGDIAIIRDPPPPEDSLKPEDKALNEALEGDYGDSESITLSNGIVLDSPKNGCAAEAKRAVFGSVTNHLWMDNIEQDVKQAVGEIRNDSRISQASIKYASCMRQKGVDVNTLKDTMRRAEEKFQHSRRLGDPPSAEEISLAVTDAECQQQAELAKVTNDLVISKGAQWIKEHEKQIMELAQVRKESLARAKTILNRS